MWQLLVPIYLAAVSIAIALMGTAGGQAVTLAAMLSSCGAIAITAALFRARTYGWCCTQIALGCVCGGFAVAVVVVALISEGLVSDIASAFITITPLHFLSGSWLSMSAAAKLFWTIVMALWYLFSLVVSVALMVPMWVFFRNGSYDSAVGPCCRCLTCWFPAFHLTRPGCLDWLLLPCQSYLHRHAPEFLREMWRAEAQFLIVAGAREKLGWDHELDDDVHRACVDLGMMSIPMKARPRPAALALNGSRTSAHAPLTPLSPETPGDLYSPTTPTPRTPRSPGLSPRTPTTPKMRVRKRVTKQSSKKSKQSTDKSVVVAGKKRKSLKKTKSATSRGTKSPKKVSRKSRAKPKSS